MFPTLTLKSLLIALLFSSGLQARDIRMVTLNWPPFYAENLPNGGPLTEITVEAFKRSGHDAHITFMPWTRALRDVKNGTSDVVLGAYFVPQRQAHYFFSTPLMLVNTGFVTRSDTAITQFSSFRDLERFRIGVCRSFATTPAFESASYLTKDFVKNQALNVKKLEKKRVDIIQISFEVFRYEHSRLHHSHKKNQFVYLKPLLGRKNLHIMMSKSIPDHEKIINDFNTAFRAMQADGSYEKILKKHGMSLSSATESPANKPSSQPAAHP